MEGKGSRIFLRVPRKKISSLAFHTSTLPVEPLGSRAFQLHLIRLARRLVGDYAKVPPSWPHKCGLASLNSM
jgi:hypothetical protein